jgi:hypothetical protein
MLSVSQPGKIFPAFKGKRMFITVFTRDILFFLFSAT